MDLRAQHDELRSQIDAAICGAIDTSDFIGGQTVERFESDFARYLGVPHVVGTSSGTDSLYLVLRALGVGRGDVVVTVPNTFFASVEAVLQTGAEPRFIDAEADYLQMSPDGLEEFLSARCRRAGGDLRELGSGLRVAAVMPVHLYGLSVDMATIVDIANRYGLPVVEDACQAHGAMYERDGQWISLGQESDAACFSFYPGKNLGAIGDAGAVATVDGDLARRLRMLRDHGQDARYHHVETGTNARLDAIQAAVLTVKLGKLEEWNGLRREAASWYQSQLASMPLRLPEEPAHRRHVYHLYVIRHQHRDELQRALTDEGIGSGLHYSVPLHLQPALSYLELGEGTFPVAERACREVLSLPMYPHISRDQIGYVVQAIKGVMAA